MRAEEARARRQARREEEAADLAARHICCELCYPIERRLRGNVWPAPPAEKTSTSPPAEIIKRDGACYILASDGRLEVAPTCCFCGGPAIRGALVAEAPPVCRGNRHKRRNDGQEEEGRSSSSPATAETGPASTVVGNGADARRALLEEGPSREIASPDS